MPRATRPREARPTTQHSRPAVNAGSGIVPREARLWQRRQCGSRRRATGVAEGAVVSRARVLASGRMRAARAVRRPFRARAWPSSPPGAAWRLPGKSGRTEQCAPPRGWPPPHRKRATGSAGGRWAGDRWQAHGKRWETKLLDAWHHIGPLANATSWPASRRASANGTWMWKWEGIGAAVNSTRRAREIVRVSRCACRRETMFATIAGAGRRACASAKTYPEA
jgi:hypothetical protein